MRIATPSFQLFTAPLTQAVEQGKMQTLRAHLNKEEYLRNIKIADDALPMGLRWNMHPEYGFPRKAFNVYRRRSVYAGAEVASAIDEPFTLNNSFRNVHFNQDIYISVVHISLTVGQRITITPFDRENKSMKGKARVVTTNGNVVFKCPFTAGFTIVGTGNINAVQGIAMTDMLNADDWELIQIVGLPFSPNSVSGLGYSGDDQGYISALTDPKIAALQRLKIGELLFTPPPSVGDAQVPDPIWQAPKANDYFDNLQNTPDSLLNLINNCLSASDDFSYLRGKRQPAYIVERIIPGVHQPGGLTPKDAIAKIPVVGTTLLSVTSESPAALGLGFGTTDFVSRSKNSSGNTKHQSGDNVQHTIARAVANPVNLGFDYMVTCQYTIRPFENFDPLNIFDEMSQKIEFCALSDDREAPVSPVDIEAFTLRTNRPEATDLNYTEAVKLRWDRAALPQGYGIIASYKNGDASVLNSAYDFDASAYQNYNTYLPKASSTNPAEQVLPNEDLQDNDKFIIVQPEEILPFKGSELHKYFIAGWDVFGRWSNFVKVNHIAHAPAKQNPGLMSVRLSKTNPEITSDLSPLNPIVPCTIEMEIAWNWADRTPKKFEVAGRFFNAANTNPPVTPPNYFGMSSIDTSSPIITITFNAAGVPSSSIGSVVNVINTAETPADLRKVKLTISGLFASFPGGSPFAVAYAVYVRGLEKVRAIPLPEDWSDWGSGVVSRMEDPRPPAVTSLPATVQFTSLPDATRLGRGRLTWPLAANALGYYVWEASETAVREAIKSNLPSGVTLLSMDNSLVDRATQLRDVLSIQTNIDACQRAFNKLSREMITGTSVELEIPASSKVLTLYQVSSINAANIESGKSNVVFFAVPQLSKPAAPMLVLRKFKREDPITLTTTKGIQVQVLNGNGAEPEGFNLYKTRKLLIGNDIGNKGLPIKEYDDAAWQAHTMRMLDGTEYIGKYVDEVLLSGSWRPYLFQAVAIGKEDGNNGIFRGESEASSTEKIFYPPDIAPTLIIANPVLSNAHSKVVILTTSAPFELIELGKTIIELYELDVNNKRTLLNVFNASDTLIASTDLAPVSAAVSNTWPAIRRRETNHATGITQFSIGVKISVAKMIIRMVDPLGRATEVAEGL